MGNELRMVVWDRYRGARYSGCRCSDETKISQAAHTAHADIPASGTRLMPAVAGRRRFPAALRPALPRPAGAAPVPPCRRGVLVIDNECLRAGLGLGALLGEGGDRGGPEERSALPSLARQGRGVLCRGSRTHPTRRSQRQQSRDGLFVSWGLTIRKAPPAGKTGEYSPFSDATQKRD